MITLHREISLMVLVFILDESLRLIAVSTYKLTSFMSTEGYKDITDKIAQ